MARLRRTPAAVAVVFVLAVLGLAPATPAAAAAPCVFTDTNPAPTEIPWELARLEPRKVWPVSRGAGVTVAVIDSGVSAQHIALKGRVVPGNDFDLPKRDGQCDHVGHGTLIAGIIAARDDPQVPFFGVAPEAKILPVRVLDTAEQTQDKTAPGRIARAIEWAADQPGVKVINLSLETPPTDELRDAVTHAVKEKDIVVVAAAGNLAEGKNALPSFPAAYSVSTRFAAKIDGVIAVAGVKQDGSHSDTSLSGDYIDVAAPGLEITGPAPSADGYQFLPNGGTSFAAPYVSGTAALIRSNDPTLSAAQVVERIRQTADNPPGGRNQQVGFGVVNPYRAVTAILGTRPDPAVGKMAMYVPVRDPMRNVKQAAIWSAGGGVLLVLVLLSAKPIMARGRAHGWRPRRAVR